MPRGRSGSGRYIEWAKIVRKLKRRPGRWSLELPNNPVRTAASVRLRRHPDLHLPDGRLEVSVRNQYVSADGQKRGDLYLRYVGYSTPETPIDPPPGEEEHQ